MQMAIMHLNFFIFIKNILKLISDKSSFFIDNNGTVGRQSYTTNVTYSDRIQLKGSKFNLPSDGFNCTILIYKLIYHNLFMPSLYIINYEQINIIIPANAPDFNFSQCEREDRLSIPDKSFLNTLIELGVDTDGSGKISYREAEDQRWLG